MRLYCGQVELLLNLVWLTASLLLAAWWMRALRLGHTQTNWNVFVALGLLLLLLFPVISMTDDLVAMASPAEAEHMVRRIDSPLAPTASSVVFELRAFAVLAFMAAGWLCATMVRLRPVSFAVTLLSGFARTAGIRPPPSRA